MRIGAIGMAELDGREHLGVVKQFDDESLTARFPKLGSSNAVECTEKIFSKAEGSIHRLHSLENSELGILLRQLAGIKRDEG